MGHGPTANGHQSQEDEGQQRSADETYDVATSPQLARRFQSVSHHRDAPQPARGEGHSRCSCGDLREALTEGRLQRPRKATSKRDVYRSA
jgi:hypothetical protein